MTIRLLCARLLILLFGILFPMALLAIFAIGARILVKNDVAFLPGIILSTFSNFSLVFIVSWWLKGRRVKNWIFPFMFCVLFLTLFCISGFTFPKGEKVTILTLSFILTGGGFFLAPYLHEKCRKKFVRLALVGAFSIGSVFSLMVGAFLAYALPMSAYRSIKWKRHVAEVSRTLEDPLIVPYWKAAREYMSGCIDEYPIDSLFPPHSRCHFDRTSYGNRHTLSGSNDSKEGGAKWSYHFDFIVSNEVPSVARGKLRFRGSRKKKDGDWEHLNVAFGPNGLSAKLESYYSAGVRQTSSKVLNRKQAMLCISEMLEGKSMKYALNAQAPTSEKTP